MSPVFFKASCIWQVNPKKNYPGLNVSAVKEEG